MSDQIQGHWVDAVKNVDRRVIYLLIFLAVAVPLLKPFNLPIDISPDAKRIYERVEALPEGSIVLVSFDYDPASRAEVHPMAEAMMEHCVRKKLKLVITALWPPGPSMASEVFGKLHRTYKDLTYGRDYVILGYLYGQTQGDPQVTAILQDITKAYPTDTRGNQTQDLPVIKQIRSARDYKFVINLSAGDPGIPAWVRQGVSAYGIELAGGATAVQAPNYLPYVKTGQMVGILGGLKGAAEYEKLVGKPGLGTSGMDAQSVAHVVIMAFILLANITWLYEKLVLRRRV